MLAPEDATLQAAGSGEEALAMAGRVTSPSHAPAIVRRDCPCSGLDRPIVLND
jgi:hypothetical protein